LADTPRIRTLALPGRFGAPSSCCCRRRSERRTDSASYWSIQQQPISTFLIDKEWRHLFEPFPYRAGIAAVKTLAATKGGGMLERNEFRFLLENKVVDLPCHQFWSQISEVELKQIVSAATNRLLDFVMDIEAENPNAGEAPASETPVPPEKVQQLVHNYFHGPVGNIAQNSSGFSQTATLNVDQVRELVATIRFELAAVQLAPATRSSADAELATIDAQLAGPTPNESIVREAKAVRCGPSLKVRSPVQLFSPAFGK
jgi:hypothetical protein